jgi:hypothetical protein
VARKQLAVERSIDKALPWLPALVTDWNLKVVQFVWRPIICSIARKEASIGPSPIEIPFDPAVFFKQ